MSRELRQKVAYINGGKTLVCHCCKKVLDISEIYINPSTIRHFNNSYEHVKCPYCKRVSTVRIIFYPNDVRIFDITYGDISKLEKDLDYLDKGILVKVSFCKKPKYPLEPFFSW